jgi:hypothetical protein
VVVAVHRRAAAPAAAAGDVAVGVSTTKYVPSSISCVSIPITARLASICSSSRKARCSSAIASSITAVSRGTSSNVARRDVTSIRR